VAAFRRQHPDLANAIREGDAQELPFPDGHFDTVLVNEVLEHVPDQDKALLEIHRVLRPGGYLVVFSPNRWYPVETHGVRWRGRSRGITFLVPYVPLRLWPKLGLGMRARNYWPRELRKVIAAAGFKVLRQDFVTQTFENNTGAQSGLARRAAPLLRAAFGAAGHVPLLRRVVSVSQMVVASKAHADLG
jgi:SAM-dependent methyltransferase